MSNENKYEDAIFHGVNSKTEVDIMYIADDEDGYPIFSTADFDDFTDYGIEWDGLTPQQRASDYSTSHPQERTDEQAEIRDELKSREKVEELNRNKLV